MQIGSLILYMIAMAITPGPNTILSMANASAVGLRKGIWLNVGMLIGISAVTAISYTAVSLLSSLLPQIQPFLMWAGAAYILYLAWKTYHSGPITGKQKSAGFVELCGLVWAIGGVVISRLFSSHTKAIRTILALSLVYCAIRILI